MLELLLHHAPQQQPWGCHWHAMYAVTGDEALLAPEYLTELHSFRVAVIAFRAGWLIMPTFTDNALGHMARVGRLFWLRMKALAAEGVSLLCVIGYTLSNGIGHAVGAAFQPDGRVDISDSLYLQVVSMTFEAFLATDYASRASYVEQVLEARLEAYPPWHAPTMLRELIEQAALKEKP